MDINREPSEAVQSLVLPRRPNAPHMTYEITPQRDAFVCIVPRDPKRVAWVGDAGAEVRAWHQRTHWDRVRTPR